MNLNWSALATLAAVALSWAGIWWLRTRQLNFSLVALFALGVGVPIGVVAGQHVEAINPIGRIYINILLAAVGPLILVTIVSSSRRSAASGSCAASVCARSSGCC